VARRRNLIHYFRYVFYLRKP